MKTSPTARALAECRARGWTAQVVERWNPYAKIRQDLFGFCDIVAIAPDALWAIQVTSESHHADRREKCRQSEAARNWCRAGGRVAVWSYGKRGARGARKAWTLREEPLSDFAPPE